MARQTIGMGLIALATVLASCVPKRAEAPLSPCETATGSGTSYSRGVALARAERSLRTQVPDARGDLVSTGVRRVRVIATRRSCEPYRVFGTGTGLVTCKVQARLCGR